jgi:outer membrane protein assembly factor BamB
MERPPGLATGGVLAVGFAIALVVIAATGSDDTRFGDSRQLDALRPAPVGGSVRPSTPNGASAVPPEVLASRSEWPLPNRDYGNTRATMDSAIRARNVSKLGVAWTLRLRGASKWGSAASGPVILGGVAYVQDLLSNVRAIDMRDGSVRWVHQFAQKAFGPNGVSVGWGKVFASDGDRDMVALGLRTGRLLWRVRLAGPTGQQQPLPYDGTVLTGIAAGRVKRGSGRVLKTGLLEPGASGFAYSLDERTGRVAWEFQTVKRGFWGAPGVNSGAGIWYPPAVDVTTGMTFWSTGNPAPAPGTDRYPNASSRPGPNLYSNSVLAIAGTTGRLRWFNQALPHDLFHHDLQNPPILAEANGRSLVIASGKMGVVYAIDRSSGRLVWKRPVGRHTNDDRRELPPDEAVTVYPGFWGGIETPGALAGTTVYYQVDDLPTPYTATAWHAKDGETSVQNLEGRTQYDKGTSLLVALDTASGAVRWSTRLPTVGFGGATVVNDLVLTATYDGMIYALRRSDGQIVWRFQAPGGINAWPAVSGDTIVWPVGLGRKPVILALRLGGAPAPPDPEARAPHVVGG